MKWNRDDWQGRRKDQVEYSETVAWYAVVIIGSIVIGSAIVKLIEYIYALV